MEKKNLRKKYFLTGQSGVKFPFFRSFWACLFMGMVRRNKWKFKSPLHQNVKHTYCIKSIQDKNAAVIIFRDLFHQNRYIFHHNGNYFIRIAFALYLSVI